MSAQNYNTVDDHVPEVGSSSRTILPIQLFPPPPTSLALDMINNNNSTHHLTNHPQNEISFTTLLTGGRYEEHDDSYFFNNHSRVDADHVDNLLPAHNQKVREYFEGYYKNLYDQTKKTVEENVRKILHEKQMQINEMVVKIMQLESKHNAEIDALKKLVTEKQKQADVMYSRAREVDEKQRLYKTEARKWKEEAKKVEEMLWNLENVPAGSRGVEDEDATSLHGETEDESTQLACQICGRRMATIMVWPCKHLCACKRCINGHGNNDRVCPVCGSAIVKTSEVIFRPN